MRGMTNNGWCGWFEPTNISGQHHHGRREKTLERRTGVSLELMSRVSEQNDIEIFHELSQGPPSSEQIINIEALKLGNLFENYIPTYVTTLYSTIIVSIKLKIFRILIFDSTVLDYAVSVMCLISF